MTDQPDPVVGATITNIRPMTKAELDALYWPEPRFGAVTVLELDNGSILFASQDPEGNGPGEFFGTDAEGNDFALIFTEKS